MFSVNECKLKKKFCQKFMENYLSYTYATGILDKWEQNNTSFTCFMG